MDVRDAVGDRMHISDEFKKDGVRSLGPSELKEELTSSFLQTTFEIGQAQRLQWASSLRSPLSETDTLFTRNLHNQVDVTASKMVRDASGSRRSRVFPKTAHLVENGSACRVYGSMEIGRAHV